MKTTLITGIIFLISIFAIHFCNAQTTARTGYFMENSTHRHLMNPALSPARGYISIPVAGELSFGTESNMQFSNFIYPSPSDNSDKLVTFMHPDIDAADFLSRLKPDNYLRANLRTSLLSFGFYRDKGFWTFDLGLRANVSTSLPYDFFAFFKEGMSSENGNKYKIRNLSAGTDIFAETAVGYSRNIMNNLRVGAKLKYLSGIARIDTRINQLDIEMAPDKWLITSQASMDVYAKGVAFKKDEDQSISGVNLESPKPGGSGIAADIGALYSPMDKLRISIGIIDLGTIGWNKQNIKKASSSGSFEFDGINDIGSENGEDADKQIKDMKDDLLEIVSFKEKEVTGNEMKGLSPTINLGAEYDVYKDKVSVGMLFSTRFMENGQYSELTGSANYHPSDMFNFSGSCSVLQGRKKTLGFAIGFCPKFINFFVACDYTILKVSPQFIPINTSTTNFQIGLSVPLKAAM